MLYLSSFTLPDRDKEESFFLALRRTCYTTAYPFCVFPQKGLERVEFDEPITIFAGGNGSGKTTLLNVIAQKLVADRTSPFNNSPFFEEYVKLCGYELNPREKQKKPPEIITGDDVFDFMFNLRSINEGIDIERQNLFNQWLKQRSPDVKPIKLSSMADYNELVRQNNARRLTQSEFVRRSLVNNVRTHSNGESTLLYFTDKIDENRLYIVDEPENSLSPSSQQKLAQHIENAARFFNCQFIIATHSPYMLAMRGARVYDFDRTPVSTVNWVDVESVRALYEFFMAKKELFI